MIEQHILDQIKKASFHLREHGVVSFPTETVYGLGIIFDDIQAYNKLNVIKNRPNDKPYTVMLKDKDDIKMVAEIDAHIQKIIDAFVPGSITLLLPIKKGLPYHLDHHTGVVGVRVPSNDIALMLLKEINVPLLVPSANKSGGVPALNSDEVIHIFKDELDFVITGHALKEKPSTIVDLTKEKPLLIREGPISFQEILDIWNS